MPEPRILTVAEALREATDLCMRRDPRVFVMGEGVADPKAIFGTTAGLAAAHGAARVMETPIAENGFTGLAIGAAMMGRRPLIVHQRVDFALLSLEQLFNNAAKLHYVSNGRHRVPLVVRMIVGRGWGQGPAHSQSLETLFAQVPGLKVVLPATAREAKGQLIAAIEDDNPVVMIEHRWVHYATGAVPEGHYTVPLDGPRVVREGGDVTIVATSYMLLEALRAAETLAQAGIAAEVIDLAVLRPFVADPIVESVRRTGRLLCVDTGFRRYGAGAEIVASVVEQALGALKAPPVRLGLPEHPTPSSRALLGGFYPTALSIIDAAATLVGAGPARVEGPRAALAAALATVPMDVPHPTFRGPF
ncbi:MAG TPA: transketolase C-terminal domain-containing protein [Azospirillum sp.]|nr:transketolase C-terminal domain-containing protein [Azospirillum sp.]